MNKSGPEAGLEARAEFFKALGHPVRLMIINLARVKPRHGEELAAILNLNPATISHHLGILARAGLLVARKDQYYQTYSLDERSLERSLAELVRLPAPDLAAGAEAGAYRDKVLQTFFRQGRLTVFPAQLKKQQIVLEKIAEEFEPGRPYAEAEVNRVLLEFHEDVAQLRRGLVEHKLLARERGIYRRASPPDDLAGPPK